MGEIKNFRDLKIWQKGIHITKHIYDITKSFPREELYGLTSQMRRAAVSIPSNIAEGFNRVHNKEYKQFLNIAYGSCAELETHTEISFQFKYLNKTQKELILSELNQESRMIVTLIKKLSGTSNK